MKYPSYGIKGGYSLEEYSQILMLFSSINIKRILVPVGEPFWVDGKAQEMFPGQGPVDIPEVSINEACQIYARFIKELTDWVNSIQPRDKVVIEEPRSAICGDYPYSFALGMRKYVGCTMTVSSITRALARDSKFFNTTDKCFYLVEDDCDYMWHSSMFEMNFTKVTPIELVETNFDPLK